ncbi:TetR/AcrR family transcriptional regulator [Halioxenophilus sp. WMMB6]|uniref:TetR/AcrR family transcriptional regulator n=1 Tax=Halioxenophilus sp. WMMB6 TaxID=3073815 RepID=UPI00295EF496|nr:TetR/AcrR family transcriptional regulator [Halioxenophilus sp. WMMB6]
MRQSTRSTIIAVADQLFYEAGFYHTSFADIASQVGISRGNFYHHFKSKEELLQAVIEQRLAATRQLLSAWAAGSESPAARICAYIQIVISNRTQIKLHGCPVGTLCAELAKLEHPSLPLANRVFGLFADWLTEQFSALGQGQQARPRALKVLAWSQGVATLYNALQDDEFVEREVEEMCNWVQGLAAAS